MVHAQKALKQLSNMKIAFVLLLILLLTEVVSAATTSVFAATPPTIDGAVTGNEWDGAAGISLGHGSILVKNDNLYLYLLVDLTGDTTDDPVGGDYFWLTFDVNIDKAITSNVDLDYGYIGTYDFCKQYYLGPGSWTGCGSTTSQLGVGFGSSMNSATPHRIWEFAINRQEIQEQSLARAGLRTSSQTPGFIDNMPENFYTDFSNLMEITLALQPTPSPSPTFSPAPTITAIIIGTPIPIIIGTPILTPPPTPHATFSALPTPPPTLTPTPTSSPGLTPLPTLILQPTTTPVSTAQIPFNAAKYVEEELNRLPPGRILFNPPQGMTVGETERVEVRLTMISEENLSEENLSIGIRGRGEPEIEGVPHMGTFMKVHLTGENFDIETLSHEEQSVTDNFTQWEFDITPEKSGIQILKLVVTVRILIPGDGEEKKDYPVFERQINVKVNPGYSVKNFISINWQWILTTFIGLSGAIIGWMYKNKKAGKKKYLQKKLND